MAKQPIQKQKLPSKSRVVALVFIGVLITIVLFAAAAILSYQDRQKETDAANQRALVEDKAKFAAVEQDMDKAYADIVAAVGKPGAEFKDKSCARPELKFKEGSLSCYIRFIFAYPEQSYGGSYAKTMQIENSLKNSPYYIDSSDSIFNPKLDAEDKVDAMSDMDVRSPRGVSCDIIYSYTQTEFYNHAGYDFSPIKTKYFSYYQYECSSGVKLAVYP